MYVYICICTLYISIYIRAEEIVKKKDDNNNNINKKKEKKSCRTVYDMRKQRKLDLCMHVADIQVFILLNIRVQ